MAIYPEQVHTLPSGEEILVRSAQSGDARALLDFQHRILLDSDYLIRTPGEFDRSVRRQRKLIREVANRPDQLMLLAISDNLVVGLLETAGSHWRRLRHGISFAVSVAARWRHRGVGTVLVSNLLNWARQHPAIERVELHVHSENHAARHLYEKLGFVVEGQRRNAVKYDDGRYMDDVIMACLVKESAGTAAKAKKDIVV